MHLCVCGGVIIQPNRQQLTAELWPTPDSWALDGDWGRGWGEQGTPFYVNCLVPGPSQARNQNRAAPLEERREGVRKLKF